MVSSYLNGMQTFTITQSGEKADLMIQFNKGIYTIEYYENTAIYPTYRKIVTVY